MDDIFGAIYLQARNDDEEFGFEESRERFLRCFVLQDATEEEAEDSTVGGYTVQIKNVTQFLDEKDVTDRVPWLPQSPGLEASKSARP